MKKILVLQWFDCKNDVRRSELVQCIEHNLKLGFDRVVIFNDSVRPAFIGDNVTNVETNSRLTFRDFLDIANDPKNAGAMVCLTNTDIKLDKKILEISQILQPKLLLSISRYESNGQLAELPWCTQDTWVLLSQPIPQSVLYQSAFPLGMPGCENRFTELFFSSGFKVFNPCIDIRNVHVQSTKSIHRDENKLFGAYLFVPACSVGEIGAIQALPTPVYLTRYSDRPFRIDPRTQ